MRLSNIRRNFSCTLLTKKHNCKESLIHEICSKKRIQKKKQKILYFITSATKTTR